MKLFSEALRLPLIFLLVLLLSGQSLASGFVLCIGEDGHTAFEQANVGTCCPAELPSEIGGESVCTDDHCGSCLDIATSFDSLQGRSRGELDLLSISSQPSFPPVLYSPEPALFVRDLSPKLHPQPPRRPATALASLRTTVLRN